MAAEAMQPKMTTFKQMQNALKMTYRLHRTISEETHLNWKSANQRRYVEHLPSEDFNNPRIPTKPRVIWAELSPF